MKPNKQYTHHVYTIFTHSVSRIGYTDVPFSRGYDTDDKA